MNTLNALQFEKEHLVYVVAQDFVDYGSVRENNVSVNNSSRRCIQKMHDHYGQCWIGKTNRKREDTDVPMRKYDPLVMVHNFDVDFVVPQFDQPLCDLLTERQNAPYTNTTDDLERIKAINARIEELNGIHLIWS